MRASFLRRSMLFAFAFLFLSISWVPSHSRAPSAASPPLPALAPAIPVPAAAVTPQALDVHKLAQAQADPNAAEYFYQQALLALGEGRRQDAVELLRVYAQTGRNSRQVVRALKFIADIDRN